jgi:hypothetical protein
LKIKAALNLLLHAFAGWALCAATMGVAIATTTQDNALYIHAVLAPVYFFVVSLNYFRTDYHLTPLRTALVFVSFVISVDFFVVALLILRSLEMFSSILGTWLPFVLIFLSTYLTGLGANYRNTAAA